jgi:hypothetical protein
LICECTHQGVSSSSSPFGQEGTRFSVMVKGRNPSITVKYLFWPFLLFTFYFSTLIILSLLDDFHSFPFIYYTNVLQWWNLQGCRPYQVLGCRFLSIILKGIWVLCTMPVIFIFQCESTLCLFLLKKGFLSRFPVSINLRVLSIIRLIIYSRSRTPCLRDFGMIL